MKASLFKCWREDETLVAHYPLVVGALLVVMASILGLLPDGNSIRAFPFAPR